MKKIKAGLLILLATGLFTGCASSGELIKSYSDTALEMKHLIISTDSGDNYDFFAKNLAVFPKNTTVTLESTTEKEASNKDTDKDRDTDAETVEETVDETEDETMEETDDDETSEASEDSDDSEDYKKKTKSEIDIDSNAGLIIGVDDLEDIYGKNIYDRVYPASITKVMTALITLQKANFKDIVTFTEDMVESEWGATLCGFEVGDQISVEQLFQGLLISSGGDAANALAIHIAGSVEAFAELMNKEAKKLGCVDTHFVNAGGLHDPNHYTSAYDIYLMFNECLKYDEFIEAIRQVNLDVTYKDAAGEPVENTFRTTNQYFTDVYDYPEGIRVLGGKTGTTDQAGRCLVLYDVDDGEKGYITLILGATDSDELYSEMNILLNKIAK